MIEILVRHSSAFLLAKVGIGSALLLGLAVLLWRANRGGSAAMRYSVLQSGLVAVALLPLALLLPGRPLQQGFAAGESGVTAKSQATRTDKQSNPEFVGRNTPTVLPTTNLPKTAKGTDGPAATVSTSAAAVASSPDRIEQPGSNTDVTSMVLSSVVVVWFGIFVVHIASIAVSIFRAHRLVRTGRQSSEDEPVAQIATQLASRLSITRKRVVVRFADVTVPLTAGLWRHTVLLPAGAREWDRNTQWMVLAHELAHVKRCDVAMGLVGKFARAIAWFNPLAWVVCRLTEHEREIACDDHVLLLGGSSAEYAECLLGVARDVGPGRLAAVSIAEPPLLKRLRTILSDTVSRGPGSVVGKIGTSLAMSGTLFACGILQPIAPAGLFQEKLSENADEPRVDKLGDPLEKHVLHRFGTRRFQYPSSMLELSFSGDEKSVIGFGGNGLMGWDALSGKQLWVSEPDRNRGRGPTLETGYGLRVLAKAAGTGEVVSLPSNEAMPIWNPRTGEAAQLQLPGADPMASAIDISPDGKLIAICGPLQLQVYGRNGDQIFEHANNPVVDIMAVNRDRLTFTGEFSYARFAPDGTMLALVNSEKHKFIQLLDAKTGETIREIPTSDPIVRYVFSPDSKTIATTERDSAVRLYDVGSGERVWETKLPPAEGAESYTSAIDFHPNGQQIAVGAVLGPDRSLRLLNAKTGQETAKLQYPGSRPWTISYSKDGSTLLSSGWDGTVHRLNTVTQKRVPLPGGLRATSVCSIAAKGGLLAFEDSTSRIHIADQKSGETIRKLSLPGLSWSRIQFSPDGSKLATGGVDDKNVQLVIWRVSDGTKINQWKWEKGRDPHSQINTMDFSPSGQQLAAGVFRQSSAYVFDLSTGQLATKVAHGHVFGCSLNDGKLVTVGWDKNIVEWDSVTGEKLRTLNTSTGNPNDPNSGQDTRMYSVATSSDQSLMATSDMTRSIRLYDRDWNAVGVIGKAGGSQRAFAMSRNALWISYTGSAVNVFDVATGEKIWEGVGHRKGVNRIEFGPRDRTLLTGADEGICNLWRFPSLTSPLDDDKLFANLVGENGKLAFAAFRQLDSEPERAVKLLESRLSAFVEPLDAAVVRKQLVALGSGRETLIEQAKLKLFELGPGAVPLMRAQLEAGSISEDRKPEVAKLSYLIHRRYRRASMLLAQLSTDLAGDALGRLADKSKSSQSARFFAESQEYRVTLGE